MNIDEAMAKIAKDHNINTFSISIYTDCEIPRFDLCAHGADLGEHGCLFAGGDNVREALVNMVKSIAEYRAAALPDIEIGEAA